MRVQCDTFMTSTELSWHLNRFTCRVSAMVGSKDHYVQVIQAESYPKRNEAPVLNDDSSVTSSHSCSMQKWSPELSLHFLETSQLWQRRRAEYNADICRNRKQIKLTLRGLKFPLAVLRRRDQGPLSIR